MHLFVKNTTINMGIGMLFALLSYVFMGEWSFFGPIYVMFILGFTLSFFLTITKYKYNKKILASIVIVIIVLIAYLFLSVYVFFHLYVPIYPNSELLDSEWRKIQTMNPPYIAQVYSTTDSVQNVDSFFKNQLAHKAVKVSGSEHKKYSDEIREIYTRYEFGSYDISVRIEEFAPGDYFNPLHLDLSVADSFKSDTDKKETVINIFVSR